MFIKMRSAVVIGSTVALMLACSRQAATPELPAPKNAKGTIIEDAPTHSLNAKGTVIEGATHSLAVKNWFTKDPGQDGVEGVSSERAYIELGLKVGVEPIVVAVIDSGVDVNHEDLREKIWTNKGEIPDNGIDDDKNGFIDDIHGWNFLGSMKDGKPVHVAATTLEVTRELVRMRALKADKEARGEHLTDAEQAYLDEVSTVVKTAKDEAKLALDKYLSLKAQLSDLYQILKADLGVEFDAVTLVMVRALEPKDPDRITAKTEMEKIMAANGITTILRLNRLATAAADSINFHYNEDFDPRKAIIGDDPNEFSDHAYGNPDVRGPDAFHGTHVSGIIGAMRNNGIGIDGIAQDVVIMAIRAVPNGDEYDKDVANAVRYAASNGARVINMSFGKSYSSINKSKVDQAFAYAASKGVVIVHSAGNDGKQTNAGNNFPNKYVAAHPGVTISNWIEVGASSAVKGLDLPAYFSNYGKETVDIFAPGFQLESSIPDNLYALASGTSMAGPCVAGVAAVIVSQDTTINGAQVRDLIRQSARIYPGLTVKQPTESGDPLMVLFSSLSSTGGIADVYAALKKIVLH